MTHSGGQGDGRWGGSPVPLLVGRNKMMAIKEKVDFFFFLLFLTYISVYSYA